MLGYLIRRVLAAIPVMGVVALFVFLLLRLTPGDPAAILAGENASPEQLERIRTSLGLNEPLYSQFFTWIGKLLHGDLGVSLISNVPVLKMIGTRVEPSISIALSTIILAILVAVPLGVIAAWKHGTWIDRFVMGLSVVGFSVPVFVIGYVLIQIFAIDLRWVPVQGFRSITAGFGPFVGPLCHRQSADRRRLHPSRSQNSLLRLSTDGDRNPSRTLNPDHHAVPAETGIPHGDADHRGREHRAGADHRHGDFGASARPAR